MGGGGRREGEREGGNGSVGTMPVAKAALSITDQEAVTKGGYRGSNRLPTDPSDDRPSASPPAGASMIVKGGNSHCFRQGDLDLVCSPADLE